MLSWLISGLYRKTKTVFWRHLPVDIATAAPAHFRSSDQLGSSADGGDATQSAPLTGHISVFFTRDGDLSAHPSSWWCQHFRRSLWRRASCCASPCCFPRCCCPAGGRMLPSGRRVRHLVTLHGFSRSVQTAPAGCLVPFLMSGRFFSWIWRLRVYFWDFEGQMCAVHHHISAQLHSPPCRWRQRLVKIFIRS